MFYFNLLKIQKILKTLNLSSKMVQMSMWRPHLEAQHLCALQGRVIDQNFNYKQIIFWLSSSLDSGNVKVMKFLIEHGADIDSQDIIGQTALHCAAVSGNCFNSYFWKTCLYSLWSFCKVGHTEAVKFLVEHGASVNATNGPTILYVATLNSNYLKSFFETQMIWMGKNVIEKSCEEIYPMIDLIEKLFGVNSTLWNSRVGRFPSAR